jgi:predicted dehydrogenase
MAGEIKLALVGASGGIAETHLDAIAQYPEIRIVGMCDLVPDPMKARAAKAGSPTFTEWREMFKAVKPDLVTITTPHPFHPAIAIDAMEAGAHVLTEKPMAVDVESADRMVAVSEKTGRILAVNYQNRLRAVYEHAKRLIDAGELGELMRVLCVEPHYRSDAYYRSAKWRGKWTEEGGGVLMNQAPHTQDILCHLVGVPRKVWGWVRTRFHPMECEDSAQAMLEYPNGAPGYIYTSTVEPSVEGRFQVVGEKAAIEIAGDKITKVVVSPSTMTHMRSATGMWDWPKVAAEPVVIPPGGGGKHADVYRDLLGAIRESRQPRCNGREGRMSVELANAIVLSSVTDSAVTMPVDRKAYSAVLADLRARKKLP